MLIPRQYWTDYFGVGTQGTFVATDGEPSDPSQYINYTVDSKQGDYYILKITVNGGVKTCHWGGAKVGQFVPRLGA